MGCQGLEAFCERAGSLDCEGLEGKHTQAGVASSEGLPRSTIQKGLAARPQAPTEPHISGKKRSQLTACHRLVSSVASLGFVSRVWREACLESDSPEEASEQAKAIVVKQDCLALATAGCRKVVQSIPKLCLRVLGELHI